MASSADPSNPILGETLTRREQEILALLAESLTAAEISAKLTLAVSSVKWYVQQLYGKLGVHSKRQAIARARELGLLAGAPAAAPAAPAATPASQRTDNLPVQVTHFFGREDDIAQVQQRFAQWRLVTLSRPGGVGKTRLGLRVAEELLALYPEGVWFVALAPLAEPSSVAPQVIQVVGAQQRSDQSSVEALIAHFGDQRHLLMLDNCEHVLQACAHLADQLLRACLGLRILATSREPLSISGEANYLVPSLPYPDLAHLPTLEELQRNTAIAMFVDRARAVVPDYEVTPTNARHVARICQVLDGIPLALELAAARVNILTAEQLVQRLDNVFTLLTSGSRAALPRHQTLRATIDWNYELLSEGERRVLQRLSVFAGGCTLEAAEAVCADEGQPASQVLDHLAALVQKSMVVAVRHAEGEPRYYLLEMVRQYASEKLSVTRDRERASQRHWQYFLNFLEAHARQFLSREWPSYFRRFQPDLENLRAALAWAFTQSPDPDAGLRLFVAFQPVWFIWDRLETGRWASKGIEQLRRGDSITPLLRARFLAWAAVSVWCGSGDLTRGGRTQARLLAKESVALARTLAPPDAETLCWSLWMLAISLDGCYMEIEAQHWDEAEALLDEQETLFPALGSQTTLDPRLYLAYNRWVRAILANYRHDHRAAKALAEESLQLVQDDFSGMHAIGPYISLGDAALGLGEFDLAVSYFEQARSRMDYSVDRSYGDVRDNDVLYLLCEAHFRRGDLVEAFTICTTILQRTGYDFAIATVEIAARILARAGCYLEAARLSAAAEAESERVGRPASNRTHAEYYYGDWRTRFADLTLEALVPDWPNRPDAGAIQAAWDEGRAMTWGQVRAYMDGLELD